MLADFEHGSICSGQLDYCLLYTSAQRVYELKETPEGVKIMCNEMQKILDDGIEIGTERGIEKGIKLCQGFGSSRELAKHKIMEEFSLSAEQAEEKLNLYW